MSNKPEGKKPGGIQKGGIQKGDPKKQIWISCRATEGCEGKYAVMSFSKKLADGMVPMGTVFRYKCLTCNMPFHIRH